MQHQIDKEINIQTTSAPKVYSVKVIALRLIKTGKEGSQLTSRIANTSSSRTTSLMHNNAESLQKMEDLERKEGKQTSVKDDEVDKDEWSQKEGA